MSQQIVRYDVEVTVGGKDVIVDLHCTILPAEKRTRDYPGSPAAIEDLELLRGGVDIAEHLSPDEQETIEQWLWDDLEQCEEPTLDRERE